jgi:hypothetical protein
VIANCTGLPGFFWQVTPRECTCPPAAASPTFSRTKSQPLNLLPDAALKRTRPRAALHEERLPRPAPRQAIAWSDTDEAVEPARVPAVFVGGQDHIRTLLAQLPDVQLNARIRAVQVRTGDGAAPSDGYTSHRTGFKL